MNTSLIRSGSELHQNYYRQWRPSNYSPAPVQANSWAPTVLQLPQPVITTMETGSNVTDARAANRARFELELEFVQSLANPFYLHSLAQQNILSQPAFINFLNYLQYWKEKEYARFIVYPHALHHLDLLQYETFRQEIGKDEWREYLNQKQFDHWRTWRDDPSKIKSQIAGQPPALEQEESSSTA